MSDNKYEIKFYREVINSTLHILGGVLISFIMVPMSSVVTVVVFATAFGSLREYLQFVRGKHQPLYIMIIDILGWSIGAVLWIFIKNYFNINADIL